jgi:hypothetical protein
MLLKELLNLNESIEDALKKEFKFSTEDGDLFVQVKSGDDFPYRIREKDGKFQLTQSFSPRIHIKPTFKKVGKGEYVSKDDAFTYIAKKHNKAADGHMKNWKKVDINS